MVIGEQWGVTAPEIARRYPCDELVPSPVLQMWRGVTVQTSADRVWPWLCQLRLAPYSYDWLDNLGHRSPRELRHLPDPVPGEPFSCVARRLRVGRVLSVVSGDHLTAAIMGAVMSYVLVPDGARTRLLLKIVVAHDHPLLPLLAAGDFVMARRQLLTLRELAEAHRYPHVPAGPA